MTDDIILVENLAKKYIISHEGGESYTALRDVISRKVKKVFKGGEKKFAREEFWALKDLSFSIKRGEAVGIIGRNGAGKSTLLKILSRITEPTKGRIQINGRVASLLEVGTGFHPELTGRENIFLNGAILGMTRAEIKKKFDEMVDFSGVEKFLDTPVKRYSSGMYVRLAFAVAAHLEPEVLVVDEVLAVGDAEFQKKCLGKMKDVSENEGRAVLFVSHNMHSLAQLCNRGIVLHQGSLIYEGNMDTCIDKYLSTEKKWEVILSEEQDASKFAKPSVTYISIDPDSIDRQELKVHFKFKSPFPINTPTIGIVLQDYLGNPVCSTNARVHKDGYVPVICNEGEMNVEVKDLPLLPGTYHLSVFLGDSFSDYSGYFNVLSFYFPNDAINSTQIPDSKYGGSVYLRDVTWELLPA